MCLQSNIKLYFVAISAFKGLFSLYLIISGASILGQPELRQAYGMYMEGVGAGLVVLGFLNPMNAGIGHAGAGRHNKFLLLMNAIFDVVLLITQLALASTLITTADMDFPAFPEELREDCLRKVPEIYSDSECEEYLNSDRYAGMRLAWTGFFVKARSDENTVANMKVWNREGGCCGFGPPSRCVEDARAFPPANSLELIPKEFIDQRLGCGDQSWYEIPEPQEVMCLQSFDLEPLEGCFCDLPVGGCCPAEVPDSYKGCASFLEATLGEPVRGMGVMLLGGLLLHFFNIIFACCFCMKRRSDDVLPDYLANRPWDPYKDGEMADGQHDEDHKEEDEDDD